VSGWVEWRESGGGEWGKGERGGGGGGGGGGTAPAQWLRCCATARKVAGSITDGLIGIFH